MMTFTDRKALNRFDRWAISVADLMRRDPLSLRADATIREAVSLLTRKGFTAAPVINEAGRPIGVLSLTDLVGGIRDRTIGDGAFLNMQVYEFMTPLVLFVDQDTPVYAVVAELLDCKVHQMYVSDDDGTLIGVLSAAELLEDLRRQTDEQRCGECTTAA
jgi:CBS-domain-containing membrane protein